MPKSYKKCGCLNMSYANIQALALLIHGQLKIHCSVICVIILIRLNVCYITNHH